MGNRGFTLIEILVVVAIIAILASIAIPVYSHHRARAHYAVAISECRELYNAFDAYYQDRNGYPASSGVDQLTLTDLAPLTSQGYYKGGILNELLNNQADAYGSPNPSEFWLQMTLRADPTVQILVSRSYGAPLAPGKRLDGISVFRNGVLSNQ